MAIKWSRVAPQLALTPSLAVTLTAFVGAIALVGLSLVLRQPPLPRLHHRRA